MVDLGLAKLGYVYVSIGTPLACQPPERLHSMMYSTVHCIMHCSLAPVLVAHWRWVVPGVRRASRR